MSTKTQWMPVIGLEVHCELATNTKLFCSCANAFGAPPNTNICPVCLGLPGSLPVLNARAVEFSLRLAEALNFTVPDKSVFARKNYFYPDMPKDYQVTQFELPILQDGVIDVDGVAIGIERAHLEEDTGKSSHMGGGGRIHDAEYSLVDYNRAGVPLLEIVSRPDIRSAEQARGYVSELRAVLLAIGVSDVKMEEGSMRVDANISLRASEADEFGTKVEIKNMNSLRSLGRAIDHEIDRQAEALETGETIIQETRHWDENENRTSGMRSKEGSSDYRYFPEPDLVPVAPTAEQRAAVRDSLPELPARRRERLIEAWGIALPDARILVDVPGLADYAEAAVAALTGGAARDVVNLCTGDLLAYLNETGRTPAAIALDPAGLADLADLIGDGTLSRSLAQEVFAACVADGSSPRAVVAEKGLAQVSDTGELGTILDAVIAANADAVAQYHAGDDKERKKKRGFLMGEAMKASKGQGNPQLLNQLLDERLV